MAVDLTLKSTEIANREAIPAVKNNPGNSGRAVVKHAYGFIASVPAALSATSIIRFCAVPSNANVAIVRLYSEAQTAGKFNIGVYRVNKDGGALVAAGSDSLFATDADCAAAVVGLDVSTGLAIDKRSMPLWQAAGLTSDPQCDFDVAATVHTTAVTTGLGKMGVAVEFVE